jgi:molybdopterin-guanine dinucleotide biosynthesis protein A
MIHRMATALILAGGHGKRMGGNKPGVELGGKPLLQWVVDAVETVADTIVFSIAPDQVLPMLKCTARALVCEDLLPDRGPLTGIFSGLQATRSEYAIAVPCDAPFLQPALLEMLWAERHGYDAVVPIVGGHHQTLVAVYNRTCIEPIEAALNSVDFSMRALLDGLKVRFVTEDEVRRSDPERRSFQNVNTPNELQAANDALAGACC